MMHKNKWFAKHFIYTEWGDIRHSLIGSCFYILIALLYFIIDYGDGTSLRSSVYTYGFAIWFLFFYPIIRFMDNS